MIIKGVVPCLACGFGETCQVSALEILYEPGVAVTEDMFYDFNASEEDQEAARRLGKAVRKAIDAKTN